MQHWRLAHRNAADEISEKVHSKTRDRKPDWRAGMTHVMCRHLQMVGDSEGLKINLQRDRGLLALPIISLILVNSDARSVQQSSPVHCPKCCTTMSLSCLQAMVLSWHWSA